MIYKFKSKAAGDVLMLQPNGDQVLRLLGREPEPKGIFESADMPAAISRLEAAVAEDEAARNRQSDDAGEADAPQRRDPVSLRQRVWPLVEMMKRSHSAGEDIVWGV